MLRDHGQWPKRIIRTDRFGVLQFGASITISRCLHPDFRFVKKSNDPNQVYLCLLLLYDRRLGLGYKSALFTFNRHCMSTNAGMSPTVPLNKCSGCSIAHPLPTSPFTYFTGTSLSNVSVGISFDCSLGYFAYSILDRYPWRRSFSSEMGDSTKLIPSFLSRLLSNTSPNIFS